MNSRAGKPNYKDQILLDVISEIIPVSSEHWIEVGNKYKELSGEVILRDVVQLKKHFTSKMCNGFKNS
jgi:hypothetical protein